MDKKQMKSEREKGGDKMNRVKSVFKKCFTLCMALVLVCTTSTVAFAAAKPKEPKKITTKAGVYYDYVKKHHVANAGDCYSLRVHWSSVSKAAGYKVKLYWDSEGEKSTQNITVTKKNGKYFYTVSQATSGMMYHCYKDVKSLVADGMMVDDQKKLKFSSKKLSFCVGGGSSERVYKISVKSYKKVNGKKVFSNAKVKRL